MGKKLIEVPPFLPLDAISKAASADKDKKTGTIKNVHKWFAPMPTPALRALIFGAVVDAPDDPKEHAALLKLVERLVPPDGNPPDQQTLDEAREAIARSTGGELPTIFDPFCGGGSTVVEAQRLGLPAVGSDLNPVPVLITRTLTELLPKVAGRSPLVGDLGQLKGMATGPYQGVIADTKFYAERIRQRVWDEVGHLYPLGANGETIMGWLWCRTVPCPNPVCKVDMPLLGNLWLSKRKGDHAWIDLIPDDAGLSIQIQQTSVGKPGDGVKLAGNRPKFRCARCREGIADEVYLRQAGEAGQMGVVPVATFADMGGRRVYGSFVEHELPLSRPAETPADVAITRNTRWFSPPSYGLDDYADIYTNRQLTMLDAFARRIADVPDAVRNDGGDELYSATIASVLGLALGKLAQSNSTQVRWKIDSRNGSGKPEPAFGRHVMPMVWDFVEANPFGGSVGDWKGQVDSISRGLLKLGSSVLPAVTMRSDARSVALKLREPAVIVTDPPYFDQIGYADLSDYFYIWHRRALRLVHPDLFSTIVAPKESELIATPPRHGGSKGAAAKYFVEGFTETFSSLRTVAVDDHPVLIVYAHRQEESSSLGTASTGWDAMLAAILSAGLSIEGTLPIRGTSSSRQIGQGTNSLASYIVMVCRPRVATSLPATIADFRSELRQRLPATVEILLATGESMIDIRQAVIGPGMEVFSTFNTVYDGADEVRVRRALSIINEELDRLLDANLGTVDDETRWACRWYVSRGYDTGEFDDARREAMNIGLGVEALDDAGIIEQGRGKVRLLRRAELPADWSGDRRTPTWEALQHLVKRLTEGATAGEEPAAKLLAVLGAKASGVRELAQYLTNVAIEKGWSDEAIAYDALVTSWARIEALAARAETSGGRLF